MKKLKLNKYKFLELADKPNELELKNYYNKFYYQNDKAYYKKTYTLEEKKFIEKKIKQKYENINSFFKNKKNKSLIDIGSGKGEFMEFFSNKKWDVAGVDYSDFGAININKKIKNKIIIGEADKEIEKLANRNVKFDVVSLNNVLEHVLNPIQLIKKSKNLLKKNSLISINVPNDESKFQNFLIKNKLVKKKYWIAYPDHINYFNRTSLEYLMKKLDLKIIDYISDFPIELFLLNDNSNYINNKSIGKYAHISRLNFEKYLHSNFNISEINEFYRHINKFGLGRNINILCKKI